jgi:tetratricopeptide (TPR) repeat protein
MPESLETHLQALEFLGLIRPLQDESGHAYRFRHALVQEAAYGSVTRRQRQSLHLAIGQVLEELFPGAKDEVVELLSYHYVAAGDASRAGNYARLAAQRALSTYAYDEAILHLQRALKLVEAEGPDDALWPLHEGLGDVYALLRQGTRSIECYQHALSVLDQLAHADRADTIRLHRKVVQMGAEIKWAIDRRAFQDVSRAARASGDSLDRSLELIQGASPHPEAVRLLSVLSLASWRMRHPPDWQTAAGHARAAVRMAAQLDSPVDHAVALEALGNAQFGLGQLRESLETAEERLEIARRPDFPDERECLDALRGAACAMVYVGEYEQAIPLLLEAEPSAQRMQSADQIFNVLALLIHCWFRLDRWEEIRARRGSWEEFERRFPQERTGPLCWPQGLRASVLTLSGDAAAGAELRDRSFDTMLRTFGQEGDWLRNAHY